MRSGRRRLEGSDVCGEDGERGGRLWVSGGGSCLVLVRGSVSRTLMLLLLLLLLLRHCDGAGEWWSAIVLVLYRL